MVNLMYDLYTNSVVGFVFSSNCQGIVCCEGYHAWLTSCMTFTLTVL